MRDDRIDNILKKIQMSDNVLIGIGKEMELRDSGILMYCKEYAKNISTFIDFSEEKKEWINKAFVHHELTNNADILKEYLSYYKELYDIVKYKNYFVVTTSRDGLIELSAFEPDKIVEPCGNLFTMQCSENCCDEVYGAKEHLEELYKKVVNKEMKEDDIIPLCPKCGKPMMFNIKHRTTKNYCEAGYMPQWIKYREWLQNTLNRDIVVLELGVGFDTPTVIRWPFEKIAFLNNKAYMIRVNEMCYQVAEGLSNKAMGINARANEFLKLLTENK